MELAYKDIEGVIKAEAKNFLTEHPTRRGGIVSLLAQFKSGFDRLKITKVADIFELCPRIDETLEIEPDLAGAILEGRRKIQRALITNLFTKKRQGSFADADANLEFLRQEMLAMEVSKLVDMMRQEKGGMVVDLTWFRTRDRRLYEKVRDLVTDQQTHIYKWSEVKEMLPADLRERFDVKEAMSKEQELLVNIEPYRELAEKLGPEAIAEFLIHMGIVKEREFSKIVGVISDYLGEVKIPAPVLGDIPLIPEGMMKMPSIKRWLFVRMRDHVYRELMRRANGSDNVEVHKGNLVHIRAQIEEMFDLGIAGEGYEEHRDMLKNLLEYYEEVLSMELSSDMVTSLTDKKDKVHFFPSLRQRIAMIELSGVGVATSCMPEEHKNHPRNRKKIVEYFMGKGKTGAAFLAKESLGLKKMLYVCPNVTAEKNLAEQIKDKVDEYYKPGCRPSVGIIRAGMNAEEMEKVLDSDVVIFPYSMMGSSVEETRIVDAVKARNFEIFVIDELHHAKNENGRTATVVQELATEIPGLQENGYIVGLTGNSTPNRPDDFVPYLRWWDPENFADIKSIRAAVNKMGPITFRNIVSDFVLMPDDPEDWEQHVEYQPLRLYPEERAYYDAMVQDDSISDPGKKFNILYRAGMNPNLFIQGKEVESAYLDSLVKTIEKDLASSGKVVVAENILNQGLLRELEGVVGPSLVERVRQRLGDDVEVCVVDGSTPQAERRRIFRDSRDPSKKMVIFAYGDIVRVGLDLSHIKRLVLLGACWNKPELAQLVMRFPRNGVDDFKATLLVPEGTVHEAVLLHAAEKEKENIAFKYGGALTDEQLAKAEMGDFSDKVVVTRGRIFLWSIVRSSTMTDRQKLHAFFTYMDGLSEEDMKLFVEQYGEMFAELYTKVWERGYGGNNGRFVAGLWKQLEDQRILVGSRYADLGAAHLALENTLLALDSKKDRTVFNLDINPFLLEIGKASLKDKKGDGVKPLLQVGSFTDMREIYPDGNFDAVNSSMAIYCTKLSKRTKNLEEDERVKALMEFNRILRPGGVMVLTLPFNACSAEEFANFAIQLQNHFGFEILTEYTGMASSTDQTDDENHFQNYVCVCKKVGGPNLEELELSNLKFTRVKYGKNAGQRPDTPATVTNEESGYIHTKFAINSKAVVCDLAEVTKQRNQEEFLRQVEESRSYLRELYEAHGNSFATVGDEIRGEWMLRGITPIDYGNGQAGFILDDDPNPIRRAIPLY